MKEYLTSIPGYYFYSLKSFFKTSFGIEISDDYKTGGDVEIQKRMKSYFSAEKKRVEELYEDNIRRHQNFTANCCPIYNELKSYEEFSKRKSNQFEEPNISQGTFTAYL